MSPVAVSAALRAGILLTGQTASGAGKINTEERPEWSSGGRSPIWRREIVIYVKPVRA